MPNGATSWATDSAKPSIPHLVAWYIELPGKATCPPLGGDLDDPPTAWARRCGKQAGMSWMEPVMAQAWLAEIGPAPHEYFASHEKLASWVTLWPGNYMSAGKRKYGRTGKAGAYIKPMLAQAAWSAVKTPGRLQARYHRLVRLLGGPKNPAAVKKAILATAHTLLKIAYEVLRSGKPYQDPGADFYTKRASPEQRRAYLLRQLEELSPRCVITITPAEAA